MTKWTERARETNSKKMRVNSQRFSTYPSDKSPKKRELTEREKEIERKKKEFEMYRKKREQDLKKQGKKATKGKI